MKIILFTTQTIHHTYFIRELNKLYPLAKVFNETDSLKAPFNINHPFESDRDVYEKNIWFKGIDKNISDFAEMQSFASINSEECIRSIKDIHPDVILVFGIGKLSPPVIHACPKELINFHGGNPEKYRGLDSHLWSIYHRDFDSLINTLHRVNEKLDDGEIILQGKLPLTKDMELYQLRRINTELCVKLAVCALDMFNRFGSLISRRQMSRGRYYSFMPSPLKDLCIKRFSKHIESIL